MLTPTATLVAIGLNEEDDRELVVRSSKSKVAFGFTPDDKTGTASELALASESAKETLLTDFAEP